MYLDLALTFSYTNFETKFTFTLSYLGLFFTMVDVELTDVEMKSQRSQPSVQSASIKEDSSSGTENQTALLL